MKNTIANFMAFVAIILLSTSINAQSLNIQQTEISFEKNTYPCIEVMLEPGADKVRDAWVDFIKDNYDVKMKGNGLFSNKDVLRGEKVILKAISDKKIDFYTRIVDEKENTRLSVFGAFGYDIPISNKNYPYEFEAMEKITRRFLQSYLPEFYQDWIKETQETLSGLKKEKENMQKELKSNTKEIEKLTERNADLRKMIAEQENAIDKVDRTLKEKKAVSSEISQKLQLFENKNTEK